MPEAVLREGVAAFESHSVPVERKHLWSESNPLLKSGHSVNTNPRDFSSSFETEESVMFPVVTTVRRAHDFASRLATLGAASAVASQFHRCTKRSPIAIVT